MRFGVIVSGLTAPDRLRETAARAADKGFDTVLVTDHLARQSAVFSTLGFLAGTTELRLGTLVLSNELRHPAVAAKELASIDVLSGGRLEIGLGVGWNAAEFAALGIPFPPFEVRVERLRQGIAVMRASWSGGDPVPHQRPHPPLLLPLGSGPSLELAAEVADIVEIGANGASAEVVVRRLDRLRGRQLDGSGADAAPRVAAMLYGCLRPDDPRLPAEAERLGTTAEELASRPAYLVGTPDGMRDELSARAERWGLSYVVVPAGDLDALAPVVPGAR